YDQHRQIIENLFIYEELDETGVMVKRTYRPLKLRWIYRYEMEHLLHLCGFGAEALYGGFDRRPLDENSREMVWVATPRRE
ncbi:MAG: class I SAM-dependent methyltransferase, partial [Anaerolineae bacterium]